MWRFVESIGRVPIYENDLKVATAFLVEDAARIVAAMNAAEARPVQSHEYEETCLPPPQQPVSEPARKAVCGTCGGSGETEEDATGALGYVVKKPCPDCAVDAP